VTPPRPSLPDEDGYELWLRYRRMADDALRERCARQIERLVATLDSPTVDAALRELSRGLAGLTGQAPSRGGTADGRGALVLATRQSGGSLVAGLEARLERAGREGFVISSSDDRTLIAANEDIGLLYGSFHLLRLLSTGAAIDALSVVSQPRLGLRVLDHWDNLDRTVERGYAGFSLWDWHKLPDYLDPRYVDYARACASLGINGSVLTNVNANALVLSDQYIEKVAALAEVFRPYGVRTYLTARFSAPIELDGLPTADPRDKDVQQWWRRRVDAIYRKIPDFGGFAVKANSEGQPGPQSYGRSHAEGAN
jgi:alpha-glucuronidase